MSEFLLHTSTNYENVISKNIAIELCSGAVPDNFTISTLSVVGRGAVLKVTLPDNRSIIIRRYWHGGFIRHFVKSHFVKTFELEYRPFTEFKYLEQAAHAKLPVPKPVFALVKTKNILSYEFYEGWLATEELVGFENFLTIAKEKQEDTEYLSKIVKKVTSLACQLLELNIVPVDLHLGNVLVKGEEVYVIDFDKAHPLTTNKQEALKAIIERWNRAVRKRMPNFQSLYM